MLNWTENGMLSAEIGSGISGERPSGKGRFVYVIAREEPVLSPDKQRAVHDNPLGATLQYWRKDIVALQGHSADLSQPALQTSWPLMAWSWKGRFATTLQLCPEPIPPVMDTCVLGPFLSLVPQKHESYKLFHCVRDKAVVAVCWRLNCSPSVVPRRPCLLLNLFNDPKSFWESQQKDINFN